MYLKSGLLEVLDCLVLHLVLVAYRIGQAREVQVVIDARGRPSLLRSRMVQIVEQELRKLLSLNVLE